MIYWILGTILFVYIMGYCAYIEQVTMDGGHFDRRGKWIKHTKTPTRKDKWLAFLWPLFLLLVFLKAMFEIAVDLGKWAKSLFVD